MAARFGSGSQSVKEASGGNNIESPEKYTFTIMFLILKNMKFQKKLLKQTEKFYIQRIIKIIIKLTCLCGLDIIILEIWKLVQITFKSCFVIKLLNGIAKNYREVYKKDFLEKHNKILTGNFSKYKCLNAS